MPLLSHIKLAEALSSDPTLTSEAFLAQSQTLACDTIWNVIIGTKNYMLVVFTFTFIGRLHDRLGINWSPMQLTDLHRNANTE